MDTTSPSATTTTPPVALGIVGHDPCGAAGQAAVLRTYAALGVHGTSALTVLTVQNTAEFRAARPIEPDLVTAQVSAVLDDLPVAATTVGLLWDAAIAAAVAALAAAGRLPGLVVDPVLASGTGQRIVGEAVDGVYRESLFGSARLITPNTVEASLLLGRPLEGVDDAVDAARALLSFGPGAVVVTGGRRPGPEAVDVLVLGSRVELLRSEWISTPNVRGSGDTFAAAATARLALGDGLADAVRAAHTFTARALRAGARWRLGAGRGPLDQSGLGRRP